jgi:hypothetical protein
MSQAATELNSLQLIRYTESPVFYLAPVVVDSRLQDAMSFVHSLQTMTGIDVPNTTTQARFNTLQVARVHGRNAAFKATVQAQAPAVVLKTALLQATAGEQTLEAHITDGPIESRVLATTTKYQRRMQKKADADAKTDAKASAHSKRNADAGAVKKIKEDMVAAKERLRAGIRVNDTSKPVEQSASRLKSTLGLKPIPLFPLQKEIKKVASRPPLPQRIPNPITTSKKKAARPPLVTRPNLVSPPKLSSKKLKNEVSRLSTCPAATSTRSSSKTTVSRPPQIPYPTTKNNAVDKESNAPRQDSGIANLLSMEFPAELKPKGIHGQDLRQLATFWNDHNHVSHLNY